MVELRRFCAAKMASPKTSPKVNHTGAPPAKTAGADQTVQAKSCGGCRVTSQPFSVHFIGGGGGGLRHLMAGSALEAQGRKVGK
jgi:hypothetical protein